MLEFSQNRDEGNVIIWVKTRKICAHDTVLNLNSRMMKFGKAQYNPEKEVFEINLAPEFDSCPDLVESIISSFYTGCLDINQSNMELIYTFALAYQVTWLAEKIFYMKQNLKS